MLTDLVEIRRLGEKKRDENERFRRHLKRHNFQEKRLRAIALEVEEGVDCRTCANCCKVATARLHERDVNRLSKFLRVQPHVFLRDYAEQSQDEGWVLKRTDQGCVFLNGTDCTVYEARPTICEDFPHVVRGAGSITARMWEFKDRACYCPIVYNSLELFKTETGFDR